MFLIAIVRIISATLVQERYIPLKDIYVNNYSDKETMSNIDEREVNTFAELVDQNNLDKTRFFYECNLDMLNDIEKHIRIGNLAPISGRLCSNPLFLFTSPRSHDLYDNSDFGRLFYRKYTAVIDEYY